MTAPPSAGAAAPEREDATIMITSRIRRALLAGGCIAACGFGMLAAAGTAQAAGGGTQRLPRDPVRHSRVAST